MHQPFAWSAEISGHENGPREAKYDADLQEGFRRAASGGRTTQPIPTQRAEAVF